MSPTLNVLSHRYEISLRLLHFTVTKKRFSNISQLKRNLWQWDDNHAVILISSILRPHPAVLIRTFTCCSATETPTLWFHLCLAPTRQKKWRASSILLTSLSRRIAACLTVHVRRWVWGCVCVCICVGGSEGSHTSVSVTFWLFSACCVGAGNGGYQTLHREAASAPQGWVNSEVRGRHSEPSDCFWTSSEALWDVWASTLLKKQQYCAVGATGDRDDVSPDRPERNNVTSWYGAQHQRRVTV